MSKHHPEMLKHLACDPLRQIKTMNKDSLVELLGRIGEIILKITVHLIDLNHVKDFGIIKNLLKEYIFIPAADSDNETISSYPNVFAFEKVDSNLYAPSQG